MFLFRPPLKGKVGLQPVLGLQPVNHNNPIIDTNYIYSYDACICI